MSSTSPSGPKLGLPSEAFEDLAVLASGNRELVFLSEHSDVLRVASSSAEAVARLSGYDGAENLKLARVFQALAALAVLRRNLACDSDWLVSAISNSIGDFAPSGWESEHGDSWGEVASMVAEVLDPDGPLAILEKSQHLAYSYSHTLTRTQVIADIRPVFDSDATEIKRATVSFVLTVEYHDGERQQRSDFSLDYGDIEALLVQCQRAQDKARAIMAQFSDCNWTTVVAGMPRREDSQ